MSQKIIILLILSALSLSGCRKDGIAKGTPNCVEDRIKDFKNTGCDKGVNVKEYSFQGKRVYVFNPGSCGADMTSEVIDSDCTTLGYLGGITGNTKINGDDFANAAFVKITWEK